MMMHNGSIIEMTMQMEICSNIRSHPLFPVLKYILLKCETATHNLPEDTTDVSDILKVVDGNCLSTNDPELDNLILDAILVLRVQLAELDKVAELCLDFNKRYAQAIKRRMNQETMLGFAGCESDDEQLFTDHLAPFHSVESNSNCRNDVAVATLTTSQGSTVIVSMDPTVQCSDRTLFNGRQMNDLVIPRKDKEKEPRQMLETSDQICENRKKTSLPRKAVEVLKSWLFQHVKHPYPSEAEKVELSSETGLNLIQVNNWFINARRRILLPMCDGREREHKQRSSIVAKNKNCCISTENLFEDDFIDFSEHSNYSSDSN